MDDSSYTHIELKPVSHITTDAIGPPGQRVFYLQGASSSQVITLIIEKFQLQTLTIGVEQFLAEVRQRMPMLQESSNSYDEERMRILPRWNLFSGWRNLAFLMMASWIWWD